MSTRINPYAGLLLIAVVLVILPSVLPNSYYLDLAIRMVINAIIVLGLNLLIGYAGQISLGHAGFVGLRGVRLCGATPALRLAPAAGNFFRRGRDRPAGRCRSRTHTAS